LSGKKHPLNPFFDILIPSPEAFQLKKVMLLGRGAGVRVKTIPMVVMGAVLVNGLNKKSGFQE
jgi:hypothetical protein